ncbi:Gmad2 immunoglobulin-like domain-containing protein [Alkaliphilus sp. B6464]|uniref:Gmad2 immunoglobulin-like domain-containing protein n=1 Tax=Alkaliphilus sp. B6464 TaxID=2731219 RepID=UPI001BA8B424|nr:Gmad2 immunoglobulin-like domain-containing protein [Alkaliphilus sp. B6464]QUH21937.1 Gmad2 immunoglobulin-like domain-containing protein [Alkaliphilus sp. B6464]
MKKNSLLLLLIVLVVGLVGCAKSYPNLNQVDTPEINEQENKNKVVILSENKDILLETPFEMIKIDNKIQIKGLTSLNSLNVDVLDDNNNVLNKEDKVIEITESHDSWNHFNKYLYFFDTPQTKKGKVRIYSSDENYVEVPVVFEKMIEEGKSIKLIYPAREIDQKGTVKVLGYASVWEGSVEYKITKENGEVITKGAIQATTAAPDTGIFAKDIKLDIESQSIILEVFVTSPKDGDAMEKTTMKLNYIKE